MTETIIVALITLAGSAIGTLSGILVSAKLTNYRLAQLEDRVNKHNSAVERTLILEEKMAVANHRLSDLECEVKNLEKYN